MSEERGRPPSTEPSEEALRIAAATEEPGATPGPILLERGTPRYRRTALALFGAGFSTFSLLYCVQPLLPAFSVEFGVAPAQSSLALSFTTGFLAVSILLAGPASESLSRKRVMTVSLFLSAFLNLAVAAAPSWTVLLALRAAEGIALGGVPAVGMAYLADEMHPRALGGAMGLYIAGNAFGGMTGRVLTGILSDHLSWRLALAAVALLGLATSTAFTLLLPPSGGGRPHTGLGPAYHLRAFARLFAGPRLPLLFASGLLLMGAFVTVYNYAGYRLSEPPFALSQTAISLIFLSYLLGMGASTLFGALADRVGRGPVLMLGVAVMAAGTLATLLPSVPAIVLGIALVTTGFFGAHAVASGWVGQLAAQARGHASSLYLLAYYTGSSVLGSVGGVFWTRGGWSSVSGFVGVLLALQAAIGLLLLRGTRAPATP